MKTAEQMFGPIVRTQRAQLQAERDDAADRQRRADEAEARLNEPLTRREVVDAIREARDHFGGSGEPVQDAIYDAFARLADALS